MTARTAPLTGQQEAFLAWMVATGQVRHPTPVTVAVRVTEAFDVDLFERALTEVTRRHEALRTVFLIGDGPPRAVVLDDLPPRLHRERADGLAAARDLVCRRRDEPYDLGRGPLVRAVTVDLGGEDRLVALAVHHLTFDAWSMSVLLWELGLAYSALRTGSTAALRNRPAMQPSEVARRSRECWPANRAAWRELLGEAPADLEFFPGRRPTDRLRPQSLPFLVEAPLADALRQAARAAAVTPLLVLLAAWSSVLSSWTGATDMVLMSPVAGRTLPGSETTLGCLFSSLLVRLDLSGQPGFPELLRRTRTAWTRSLSVQDYPYAEFADRYAHAPCVGYYSWDVPLHLPGLDSTQVELPSPLVDDLEIPGRNRGVPQLTIVDRGRGTMPARLAFNAAAFDSETVEQLAEDLVDFLRHVC